MFEAYFNLQFKVLAYTVGYLYLAFPYAVSFVAPPLKRVIQNYEKKGSTKSMFVISFISGSLFFYLSWFQLDDMDLPFKSIFANILFYLGYIAFGFFNLFFLADYRSKYKTKT